MKLAALLLAIANVAVLVWTLWVQPPQPKAGPPPAGGDLEIINPADVADTVPPPGNR
jgi:hypothetical protein